MEASRRLQDITAVQERIQKIGGWFERLGQDIYETYRPIFEFRHLLSNPYSQPQFQNLLETEIKENERNVRLTIISYALAALAAKLVLSDGELTAKKRKAYASIFSLQGITKEKMVTLLDVAANDKAPALQYARQLKALEVEGDTLAEKTLRRLCRLSMIETPLTEATFNFICMVGEAFGYTVEEVSALADEVDGPGTGDAYTLLKIAPNATLKHIQEAYRERLRNVHPDRWKSSGKTQYLHRRFTAKAAAINNAYRLLTGVKTDVRH